MRVLFDQGTPLPLREALTRHEVSTAYERGWSTLKNGDLLDAAERYGGEMNRWKIPDLLEREIRRRDIHCVYCRTELGASRTAGASRATWEHIVNDATIVNDENIARCCASCNSSKGTKRLIAWLESDYCRKRAITKDSVADVVKRALAIESQAANEAAGQASRF